jgi:hypothetical protein
MVDDERKPAASGGMEGHGAYNRYGKIPASGSSFAFPFLERATQSIEIEGGEDPIVIADYGSSQGRNSFAPMRIAIEVLRSRIGAQRPIIICHTDLPINDFKSLFELLEADPDRYSRNDPEIFPCAIGRSFYQNVLPPNHVHLGWCSYAAMWISQIPQVRTDHFFVSRMTGDARAAFERQGAQDWENFLLLRAKELRSGGRLIVVVPGANEEGWSGYEDIHDHAHAVLTDMVREGAIGADEFTRMALGVWPRRRKDLLAPFQQTDRFHSLVVEHCETSRLADPAWSDFERDGNKNDLIEKQAGFYRSIFVPTLASSLRRAHDAQARQEFSDRLERGLKNRLVGEPAPINSLVETIVFAKTGDTKDDARRGARATARHAG